MSEAFAGFLVAEVGGFGELYNVPAAAIALQGEDAAERDGDAVLVAGQAADDTDDGCAVGDHDQVFVREAVGECASCERGPFVAFFRGLRVRKTTDGSVSLFDAGEPLPAFIDGEKLRRGLDVGQNFAYARFEADGEVEGIGDV